MDNKGGKVSEHHQGCNKAFILIIMMSAILITIANTALIIHLFMVQSHHMDRISSLELQLHLSNQELQTIRHAFKDKSDASTLKDPINLDKENTTISRSKRTAESSVAIPNSCLQGAPGRDGKDGNDGRDGKDGRDGRDGAQGAPGINGLSGDELTEILNTFQETAMAKNTDSIKKYDVNGTGAVYIRWGRTICPPTATLVYDGVVGGSYYGHTGGGAEKLCLPNNPQWGKYQDGFQSFSYMYGAEYQTSYTFTLNNANGASVYDHDVPCAVCHTESRSSQLMIPAWKECPATWTKEYSGYLMAEHYGHHRSSFDCVDEAPEVVPGGQADQNGAVFFFVVAQCGSLPCPDYVEGRELTCVVCTK